MIINAWRNIMQTREATIGKGIKLSEITERIHFTKR
jgi:hypothetical protein